MDYIEEKDAMMLSDYWKEFRHDKTRRDTLFKDLSRIMLSLGRIALPRIGSFTMDNEGVVSLTNQPLNLLLQQLENERIPTKMPRHLTYTATEPYLLDLLALHGNRLRYQLNAVTDAADCQGQMAALTGMRSVLHHFYRRDLRSGPFFFTLTDIHQSNVFVDADWHIKYVVDLEWACSLPVEMQHPPCWLTDRAVDQLDGEHLVTFSQIRAEFMDALRMEEKLLSTPGQEALLRTRIMENGWDTGKYFYMHALDSTVGLFALFWQLIQPRFARSQLLNETFDRTFAPYRGREADEFVSLKAQERERYDRQLHSAFKTDTDQEGIRQ